jgi:oxygen-independent coproporphyrinogen-3 oxidase
LKEWDHYLTIFGAKPVIRELHLGGGTPTFFSPENLKWLISYLLEAGRLHNDHEFSFEGHPNNTTHDHLETLYDLGFRRVSFGVQDLDPKVQKTINRVQPFENLERVTTESRRLGYTSISFDLIYGLPHQTPVTIANTINKVLQLRPDRVSFYSYAHVPWVSPGQRGYGEADLPTDVQKRNLYELGRHLFRSHGYEDVGMDHFALSHDALFRSQAHGTLHRNFMGYTTNTTDLLVGLGASAISDAKYAYAQNVKKVEDYGEAIREGKLAVFKGHILSDEDMQAREIILEIACQGKIADAAVVRFENDDTLHHLREMVREGILRRMYGGYQITESGRPFIRNVCSLFDQKLRSAATENHDSRFSKAI